MVSYCYGWNCVDTKVAGEKLSESREKKDGTSLGNLDEHQCNC